MFMLQHEAWSNLKRGLGKRRCTCSKNNGNRSSSRSSRDVAQAQQQLEQVQCALTAARAACSTQQPAIAVQQHVGGQKRRPDYRAMNGGDEENEVQEGSFVISEEESSSRYNHDCTNNACFVPNYQAITKF
jgi:hypothetical protein